MNFIINIHNYKQVVFLTKNEFQLGSKVFLILVYFELG